MRLARLLSIALLSSALVAACTTADAGWTYAPAPSKAPQPSGSAGASAEASGPAGSGDLTVLTITASGIKYEESTLTAPADTPFQIKFVNNDAGVPHNVALHLGDVNGAELFKGTIFPGVETRAYDVPALDAGAYAFVCDVHPTMIGTLNVQ